MSKDIKPDSYFIVTSMLKNAYFIKKKDVKLDEYLNICSKIWGKTHYVEENGQVESIHFSFIKEIEDLIYINE